MVSSVVNSTERRSNLASEELELTHDVAVRHAGKEGPTDEMSHAVLLDEAADLRHALLGAADDKAILHELVEIRRDRRVDERMAPAARVLFAVGDHDVPLGEDACLLIGVGDDEITRQWPLLDGAREPGHRAVLQKLSFAVQQSSEVCRRTRKPVVCQGRRSLQREVAPTADPYRGVRLRYRLWLHRAPAGGFTVSYGHALLRPPPP